MSEVVWYSTPRTVAIQEKIWHNGCPSTSTTATHSHTTRYTSSNVKESRPRPPEPLWKSPTGQARQETKILRHGVQRSPASLGAGTDCYGSRSLYDLITRQTFGEFSTFASFPASLDWQTKMRLDIKDVAVNLGVSLVEYRQTADMFQQFASGTLDAWRRFRRKQPTKRRKRITPCNIAAAELVYSYGIEPLASDLFDSFYALQGRLLDPVYRRFISTKRDRGSETVDYLGKVDVEWQMLQRAIAYVELETNRSDFTLGNPLELAWEVVPYSFVVDWAIPVGDYLSALDALKDVKKVIGTVTTKRKSLEKYTHINVTDNDWVIEIPSSYEYTSHERTVLTGIPLPARPTYDPSKSWRAIMHGISLLTQLSSKCRGGPRIR